MGIITNSKTVFILFLLMFFSENLFAASNVEVNTFSPTVSAEMTYTDNVNLTNDNEDSDLVTRMSVGLGASGISTQGSRLRTQLNYSVSGLGYNSNSDLDDVNHNLAASANAEIVKNAIFLDAFANTRGVLLDQNRNASSDRVSGSENLTDTYTYGLDLSWKKNWDRYATSNARYSYDEVKFSGSSQSDSTSNRINLQVASGPKFNEFFWDLNYNYNETSYDDDTTFTDGSNEISIDSPDTTNEIFYVTLGHHYSRLIDLRIRLGYEDYDSSIDDGFGWTIGGTWRPSPRTSLEASWGERAFGRTAFLDFSHRHKKITWQLNYNDDVTNSRGQIVSNSRAINDINANPDNDQSTNLNNTDVPLVSFNPNLYLTRRLTGSASYPFKRSTATVRLYFERVYYDDADDKDVDNIGSSLNWNHRLGRETSMNTSLYWDKLDDLRAGNTQHRKTFSWSLSRSYFSSISASIRYTYTKNDADLKESEYDENRITASISKSF